ncbi:MAG: hypothetical protein ACYTF7_04915 [Planctomycetota bacterium]|jgi:hypothetical protein
MRIEGSSAAAHAHTMQALKNNADKKTIETPAEKQDLPVRRADTAQLASLKDTRESGSEHVITTPAPDPSTRLVYGQEDLARLQEAWGATSEGEGYIGEYDFDGNGTIDGADLGQLLGLFGQEKPALDPDEAAQEPRSYGTPDIVGLRAAWNTREGDDTFRSEYDFNGDGVINGADLGQLLGRIGLARQGANTPGSLQKPDDQVIIDDKDDDNSGLLSTPPLETDPIVEGEEGTTARVLDPSLGESRDQETTVNDSALFGAILPEEELGAEPGTISPDQDARDLSLLLNELGLIEEDARVTEDKSRADILADIRSSFTQLLSQPLEARDSLSLLLGRLSQGGGFG